MIYFDNAATTKPCEQAIIAAAENMRNNFGNASSLHKLGIEAEKVLTSAKKTILARLGLDGEIYFTSGATESNNTALLGVCEVYKRVGNRIVTTSVEHPSVARVMDKLEAMGFEVVRIAPKDCMDSFEQAVIGAVDGNTLLVSTMAVNNETGFHIDVQKIYRAVKAKYPKCMVHVDGVQGFCKVPLAGDFISMSAHKIHGIKGVGALYCAKGARFAPLLAGGGQQKNLRSGTEPIDIIAGFEAAVKAYPKTMSHLEELYSHTAKLLSGLEGVTVNSKNNIPSILNFSVQGVRSEIMLHYLEESQIYISSGSACSKGKKSAVLSEFGISDKNIDSAIRVSFNNENTIAETEQFVDAIYNGIKRFRR